MFKQYAFAIVIFFIGLINLSVYAEQPSELSKKEQLEIANKLSSTIGMEVVSIKLSPLSSLVEVVTEQGMFYASKDGNFLLHGKLYGLSSKNVVNHTEESLAMVRVEGLKQFEKDMIVYPAKDEKHVVTVFTDITCGYCRKMHKQMDEYNDLGITIRYMAYPRAGIKDQLGQLSQGFKDLRSIWCHEEPKVALTKAKLGSSVAQRICDKPIEEEFDFGRQIGVNSTPSIIFENGFMLPGYKEPADLLTILKSMDKES